MVLASHSSPTSSFFVLPVILAKLFYCVALNPRGFHTFPQCLDLLITNPKSSFLPTAAGATAASPLGSQGGFVLMLLFFFFFPESCKLLGKGSFLGSWCGCRGCTPGGQELGVCAENKAHSPVVPGSCCLL